MNNTIRNILKYVILRKGIYLLESKYEYIKRIEGGVTCETFLVRHKNIGEYRILKKYSSSEQNKKHFDIEIGLLKNIKGKGIPILYDLETNDKSMIIVEEYIDGKSLKQLLMEKDTDICTIIGYVIEICSILYRLHQHGMVYLDIKPQHIIINPKTAFLIDYGNSAIIGSKNSTMLSERYAAPEQFCAGIIGEYTDIYSIGVLLMEINSFYNTGEESLYFREIIEKCMNSEPRDRFGNMENLTTELQFCMEQMSNQYKEKKGEYNNDNSQIEKMRSIFRPICLMNGKDKKRMMTESYNTIYIYGLREYIGCTHLSLALAHYLSKTYGKTEYISEGKRDSFLCMMNNRILIRNKTSEFMYNNFRVTNNRWNFIQEQKPAKFCIVDRGFSEDGIQEMEQIGAESVVIVVISDASDWNEKGMTHYKLSQFMKERKLKPIIVANFMNKSEYNKIRNQIAGELIRMPLFDNPIKPNGDAERFINQIVKKISRL